MTRDEFEQYVQTVFDDLPERFREAVDNVRIVVEDVPPARHPKGWTGGHGMLLGLYEGVPLPHRGPDYGMYPVVPDTITLYQRNLERIAQTEDELRHEIRQTLIHELGHYFGMNEAEIRRAGY